MDGSERIPTNSFKQDAEWPSRPPRTFNGQPIVPTGEKLWSSLSDAQLTEFASQITELYLKNPFAQGPHPEVTDRTLEELKTDLANIFYTDGKSEILDVGYQLSVAREYLSRMNVKTETGTGNLS